MAAGSIKMQQQSRNHAVASLAQDNQSNVHALQLSFFFMPCVPSHLHTLPGNFGQGSALVISAVPGGPPGKDERFRCLNVLDHHLGGAGGDRGQTLLLCSMSIMLAPDGVSGTRIRCGGGTGEDNSVKVGEGDERAALLVVLDGPLGILLAQRRRGGQRLGTVVPLVLFSMTAVPALVAVAVTVTLTLSPVEKEMPEKS
ncbi:hypothetical protein FIBSPDRAFT_932388 [Athelia psychrophila]|uniref:Uncharacterized protein n=1 Tax=Athelia psychrophila TaxID=1759441 RepID=A0A166J0S1_9AGAM|nr:hypothetical protein FIBSPDRAFT_932388 [Fibularhizoctonia sp. CBS 109695]